MRHSIAWRIGPAKNADGISGLQIAAGKDSIKIERQVSHGERANAIGDPCQKTFHYIEPVYSDRLYYITAVRGLKSKSVHPPSHTFEMHTALR